ncbi:MAG: GAF domain-containing protein [Sphingobacteriales bacterium]|nr:MAG: GAF domain-containing protein [Sphingobacteriales bacterium]
MPYEELKRLEAVNRFLQIKINKQEEFEEISQLVAEICNVPRAMITLISEDTEFVLSEDRFAFSSERGESFCHYVLKTDDVMVVADAQTDNRLKNYKAVKKDAGIRFYAGAPLTTHDGHRLGSLCVIDQRPGDLTQLQTEMLQNLANQVIQLLEFESNLYYLKLQYLEAKAIELKMRSFFESQASSHLLVDRDLKVVCFNKAVKLFVKKIYDVDMQVGMDIKQFIHVSYMAEFVEQCGKALSGESICHERLLIFADDSVWCMLTYDPALDNDGEIMGVSWNLNDISKRVGLQLTALDQQSRLDHLAYMQSHEFSRPVATIKGLVYLLELDGYNNSYPELNIIKAEMNDIDVKISKIVDYTISK